MGSKSVLCVGLVCVDIVQVCNSYPLEDSDQRCLECYLQRGGNASNNCTVLSQMGVETAFFGSLSKGMFWDFVERDFRRDNVGIEECVFREGWDFPISTVIVNSSNGSRTIIHSSKGYTEPTLEDFMKLDLRKYSWIHFEGRNLEEVKKMMMFLKESKQDSYRISVELEKPKEGLMELAPLADVIFMGKDFAQKKGWSNMTEAVNGLCSVVKESAIVVCAWGEDGAVAKRDGEISDSPAYPPEGQVIDTLGAGDTFCAAVIAGLNKGLAIKQALELGCKMAGAKVGIRGYHGLKNIHQSLMSKQSLHV